MGIKIVEPKLFVVEEVGRSSEEIGRKDNPQISTIEGLDKTWGVKAYGIKNYINQLKGKKKIKVAVIDTGIDPNHEDLK